MTFPVLPPPSSRARELAQKLSETVERYRSEHPGMSAFEVRQALGMAARGNDLARRRIIVLALAIAAVAGGIAAVTLSHDPQTVNSGQVAIIVTLGMAILGLVVFFKLRS